MHLILLFRFIFVTFPQNVCLFPFFTALFLNQNQRNHICILLIIVLHNYDFIKLYTRIERKFIIFVLAYCLLFSRTHTLVNVDKYLYVSHKVCFSSITKYFVLSCLLCKQNFVFLIFLSWLFYFYDSICNRKTSL